MVQLYFDLRREALLCAVVFFVANGTLTWISMDRGIEYYGAGYALAGLIGLFVALVALTRALNHLEFLTFARLTAVSDDGSE